LGFTALELLKGPQFESLFPGTGKGAIDADIAWLRWHSSADELPPMKKLVKNIPDDLAHVLDRMLKKRVADRPQSAQEVLKDLADRPLVAVPVAGAEESPAGANDEQHFAPGVVRTISAPQTFTPRGTSPAVNLGDAPAPQYAAAGSKPSRPTKATASPAKPAAKPYSKEWFNQQLGRPYVLYPLCALILLVGAWFSYSSLFGGPSAIPVTFNVDPDAKGMQVFAGTQPVAATPEGKYMLPAGKVQLTLRKEGFHPITAPVEISAEKNKFPVKFVPIIKYVDIAIQVTPANAELKVAGAKQSLTEGKYTHKLEEGQPLKVEANLDKYVTVSRSISADELKTLGNKVSIELEKEKPKLPEGLAAKEGAAIDPDLQLPTRVLASRLEGEPLELVLVKPGTYKFGVPDDKKRSSELTERSVRIDQPYYIALHETTNAQYQKFFEAAGEAKAGNRWQTASRKWAAPQNLDAIKNHLPVTNVSADQAQAFCTWVGGQLPSEIEWECAVRGTDDKGFPYPWGAAEPSRDNCRIFYGERLERGEGGPVPVEQLTAGASRLGLLHAIGNAAEWCRDTEERGNFILRGCSIATANINDVRVTWRGRGDLNGEESTGFRVMIPAKPQP
jgi:formylglycine-generating enzyme required for sulfatase activity